MADEDADDTTLTIEFWAYGVDEDGDEVYRKGTLDIEISSSDSDTEGDVEYQVDAGEEVTFSRGDFSDCFKDE